MSYNDFDAFKDFMTDWIHPEPGVMDDLWEGVCEALPASVISAAIWADNEFARELLKQAVMAIGREQRLATMADLADAQVRRPPSATPCHAPAPPKPNVGRTHASRR